MDDKYYIGLMSGTSMDGVDVVIATFSPMPKIWYQMTHPFPPELKERILNVIQGEKIDIRQVGDLDAKLGELFADSVLATLNESKIKAEEIKAIGSHGHTFWHEPFGDPAFSMQLGDPTRIAVATGIDTIADFRRKDIALGGQGAPLVPAFHAAVFSSPQLRVILNIGGISNITVLRGHQKPLGYDTGPGNVLLDIWTKKNLNKNYDEDGEWAKSGQVIDSLLEVFLEDDYLKEPPPKSTGREHYNSKWLMDRLYKAEISQLDNGADVARTILEFSVLAATQEIAKYGEIGQLYVCGGGAKNPLILDRLAERLPMWQVRTTDQVGISSDYLEALAFAWLAYRFCHKLPANLPSVTGASKHAILGVLYPAN